MGDGGQIALDGRDRVRLGARKTRLEKFTNHDRCVRQWSVVPLDAEANEYAPIGAVRAHGIHWSADGVRVLAQQRGVILEQSLDLCQREGRSWRQQLAACVQRSWVRDRGGFDFDGRTAPSEAVDAGSVAQLRS